jgi:hypothetical protein
MLVLPRHSPREMMKDGHAGDKHGQDGINEHEADRTDAPRSEGRAGGKADRRRERVQILL